MADKRKLIELDLDVEGIITKSTQLKTELDKLKASQNELKKSGDTNSETYIKLAAQLGKVSSEYNLNQKQLANLAQINGNYLTINQKVGLSLDKEINSISAARQSNSELLKIRNELNLSKESEARLAAEINAKLDANNKFIKENVSQYEQQKIGIGDYKTAIVGAIQETGLFGGQLQNITQFAKNFEGIYSKMNEELKSSISQIRNASVETEGMGRAQAASAAATNVSTGALRIFKLALAATGIGLLIIALGSLLSYFTQTQAGIDKLNSVLIPLKTIFSAISGVVSELGGKLIDTFSNPKKALEDLGNFVKQNLINRFTAFGKILDGILTLDFKKVADGALQAGTGVENLTGKIANGAKASAKFLEENAKKGSEIAKLTKEIEEAQIKYNGQQRKTGDLIDAQLLISKDTSKTFAEREAASMEIIRLTKGLGEAEEAIIDKKIRQLKLQMSLGNVTNEQKREMEELLNAKEDAGDRGVEAEKEQIRVIAGARKEAADKIKAQEEDRIKKQKEAIDILIEKQQIGLNKFIADQGFRAKSLDEGLKIAEQVRDKELAILDFKLKKGKITQEEYDLEVLNSKQKYLKLQADATVEYAQIELNAFLDNNKSKLEANQFLTDELVAQELDRINRVSEAEAAYQTKRLEQGQINAQQYADAIKAIDDKVAEDAKALQEEKAQADLDKQAIDLENKIAATESEFESRQLELDNSLTQELAAAEKTGASRDLIEKKYAVLQKQLDKDVLNSKMNSYKDTFSMIKGLVGENTAIGKAAAIAEIGINTYQQASKAFSIAGIETAKAAASAASYDFVGSAAHTGAALNANVQGGLIIAGGVAQAAKVSGLKLAKGTVDLEGPGTGTSDSIPAMLSRGESVITAEATANNRDLLRMINANAGIDFSKQVLPSSVVNMYSNNNNPQTIDYDLLASKIGAHVGNANLNLPKPIVYTAITDINDGQGNYAQVVDGASF